VRLRITVQPGSKKEEIIKQADGTLHVRVKAPARENKANEAVIRIVARFLEIPKSSVHIKAGLHSRRKLLEISEKFP